MTDRRPFRVLFSYGFRPFFLLAGLQAVAGIGLWLANLLAGVELTGPLDPLSWHIHEMIFGFAAAAVAGFSLTAIPNWTGRLPVAGWPLAVLTLFWIAGRLALLVPGLPLALAAAIDGIFLVALVLACLREILAGRNWRNLPVIAAFALLALANLVFWLEHAGLLAYAGYGHRMGLAVLVALIGLIGGRIVPSFTRNWLAKRKAARLPAPFGRFDRLVLLATVVGLAAWVLAPDGAVTGPLLGLAALANLVRLARWRGLDTLGEPLVWVLHLAYLWIPLGLGLAGAAAAFPGLVPASAAIHALGAGAIAQMVLAVMTRATLGHTGRALAADGATTAAYVLVWLAAATRIATAFQPAQFEVLIVAAAALWTAGFALFLASYGPKLWTQQR
ncbi:MAG: NnrS family protein [Rhodospirillaceae bacterium]|nr:NnrS family protein [Rhodospirillaceae bacterium]